MGAIANPGIVTGLHAEVALIRKLSASNQSEPLISCHGPGPEAARRSANELISKGVGGLISFGFAGGLDERLAAGTVVLATEIRAGRYDYTRSTDQWRDAVLNTVNWSRPPIEEPIAAVDKIVSEASDKNRLRYQTDAVAADMESFAVGRAAHQAGLPFIAVRAISDPALQSLPIMALDAVDADGKLRPGRILWSLIRHPGQLRELVRLADNTRAAADALSEVVRQVAPHFCLPDFRRQIIRQLREVGDPLS
ncbi:MAG: hypothetical protein HKN11_00575 [Rhizobiales bacterium]|nr:hypothetical protein [Hyphomicrobiales bacterium]